MTNRVPDSITAKEVSAMINSQRKQLNVLQERITTGKRINRASDDPVGAGAILRLKTSKTEIEQFRRSAEAANQKLAIADGVLNNYSGLLDRVRTLVSQGSGDTTPPESKNILAVEIDSLRSAILRVANSQSNDEFVFGGTRQSSPPYDELTGAPNPAPTAPRFIQIEPGTNAIASGVIAEDIFAHDGSDIFADLEAAADALRGTGDAAADKATLENVLVRLSAYADISAVTQAKVGTNMALSDIAKDRLNNDSFNLDSQIGAVENDDLADSAIRFNEAQTALEATLQIAARSQRNLLDFLG